MIERVPVRRMLAAGAWAAALGGALAIRVLPAWSVVFSPQGVNYQGADALYHVRTIHNLLAHFPWRSGFDPYALFPGGQNVPTGPLWDYLVAVTAWIGSAGAPSPRFVDAVAAWLPAILGALFPLPAYFLALRFFGKLAAGFAALWMATVPGVFLWLTHLGFADHHAAEGLFAFLTLAFLCAAIEAPGRAGALRSVLAGVALGAFLATRPAGVFVPAILAVVAPVEPAAALPFLAAACVGALIFIPVTGAQWSNYTWLVLAGAIATSAASLAFSFVLRRRRWPGAMRWLAPPAALAATVAVLRFAGPRLFTSLWSHAERFAVEGLSGTMASSVGELQPVFRVGGAPHWLTVLQQLGVIWIPTLPALVWVIWCAFRARRPALTLLAVWGLAMTVATVMQARMVIYFVPLAAVLAGAACGRMVDFARPALGRFATVALVAIVAAVDLVPAIKVAGADSSPNADSRAALEWLRKNTPEPFANSAVWAKYYPRQASRAAPADAPAWGVIAWWDWGYAVEELARRVPMGNGTQIGAKKTAWFFTETAAESAVSWLRQIGARYVLIDPPMALFAGQNVSRFPVAVRIAGRDLSRYFRVLIRSTPEGPRALPVYLPDYYRTMAARLFLSDGAATSGSGPWLFITEPRASRAGTPMETISWARRFVSESEAGTYMRAHPIERFIMGCIDPGVSCFELPAIKGLRRVFSSDPLPISHERTVRAVKIFEVIQDQELLPGADTPQPPPGEARGQHGRQH